MATLYWLARAHVFKFSGHQIPLVTTMFGAWWCSQMELCGLWRTQQIILCYQYCCKGGNFVVVQDSGNVVMFIVKALTWFGLRALGCHQHHHSLHQRVVSEKAKVSLVADAHITEWSVYSYSPDRWKHSSYGPVNSPNITSPVVWGVKFKWHIVYPWFLVMQGDGNLVAYDSDGNSLASNTEKWRYNYDSSQFWTHPDIQ